MQRKTSPRMNIFLFLSFAVVFGLAFARIYLRVHTTLLGYEIGRLKHEEAELLEERAYLQMVYAKLTTKAHLQLLSEDDPLSQPLAPIASNH